MTSVVFIDLDLAALTRQNPASSFLSNSGYHHPAGPSVERTGRQRPDGEGRTGHRSLPAPLQDPSFAAGLRSAPEGIE